MKSPDVLSLVWWRNKVWVCPQWGGDVNISGVLWLLFHSATAYFLSLRGKTKSLSSRMEVMLSSLLVYPLPSKLDI